MLHDENYKRLFASKLMVEHLLRACLPDDLLAAADLALCTQQQSIVSMFRVIDAVMIDDQRLHEPAEFQQRMPFAAVSGQPRSFDGEHGSHRPLAQLWPTIVRTQDVPVPEALTPRSSSITSTSAQPKPCAFSCRLY